MKVDSKALHWILLGGLGLSVIIFFVVMVSGLSFLSSESQKMVKLKVQSRSDDTLLSNLEETKKEVEKYSYFKTAAQTVIPNDKDQAAAVVEINQIAASAGIALQGISFPASSLGLGTAALGTSPATGSASASTALSQATAVTDIPGLYSLELTITPQTGNNVPPNLTVTYPKMLKFLEGIENNRRTSQITSVDIQSSQAFSFTLTVNIFIKPQQ